MVKALGMLFIFPFNFLLVGYQPQRFMGLFLQILFGANPAIKPIYEFLMVQFYKILINSLAQICKNTVNLFVKKHNEIFAAANDMPLIVNHFPVFIWEIPFFFKNLGLRFQK